MALDLSTREKRLEVATAAIWVAATIKQTGEIPTSAVFTKTYPQFSFNDILFIISNIGGVASLEELKEKIDQVLEKLELYRQTLLAQEASSAKITRIPESVVPEGASIGDFEAEVKALELKLEAAQFDEWLRGFSLAEKVPVAPTFHLSPQNPPEPQSSFEEPAEVLVQTGLVSEEGVPAADYSQKLEDPAFKEKVEAEIKKAVLTEHLENLLTQNLSGEIEGGGWAQNLADSEKRFILRSVASEYANVAASKLLGATPEDLPNIQGEVRKSILDQFDQDRPEFGEFLDAVLAVNPNFAEIALRKKTVDEATDVISRVLSSFQAETVATSLETQKPKVVVSHFKLIGGKPVREDFDYYIVPKTPIELEADYAVSKAEVETLFKVLFAKNKVVPIAPVAGGAGVAAAAWPTKKPEEKEVWLGKEDATFFGAFIKEPSEAVWGRIVAPPVITVAGAVLAITNPATAIFALPTLAVGYQKYSQIQDKIQKFKKKVAPFVNPAGVIEKKYQDAWKAAAWAIPKALLFRTYTLPDTNYKYKDFWPTAVLGGKLANIFVGWSAGRADSVWRKAAENLKPYYWDTKGALKKRGRRGPWGVIAGLVVVDILGTLTGRLVEAAGKKLLGQARWLRLSRTLKSATGIGGNIAGGVLSFNTAAGYLLGSAVGGPAVGALGAALGAGYQIYLNFGKWIPELPWAKDVTIREAWVKEFGASWTPEYLAQAKPKLNLWQRLTYRPSVFLSEANQLRSLRSGLLNRVPLKGFTFGFLISGGNPIIALWWAGVQLAWSSRGYLPKIGLYRFSGGKYASFAQLTEKGPAWARFLKGGRFLGGAGIGGVLAFAASGLSLPWALAGVAAGGVSWFAITKGANYLSNLISPYTQRWLGPIKPYWKGAAGGFAFAALLAGLGLPVWAALIIGVGGGIVTQYLWRRFAGQIFAKTPAGTVATGGSLFSRFLLKLPARILGIVGIGALVLDLGFRLPFSLTAEFVEGKIKSFEADYAAGKYGVLGPIGDRINIYLYKGVYYFLKGVVWVIDRILWPFDKLSELLFHQLVVPFAQGLYKIGAWVLGWTQNLPGFLGGWARNIGGFFKGVFGGAAQAIASAILGLLGAIFTLLTGGDIVEAALVGAIGLVIGGSLLNAQTISSAFHFTQAPIEFEAQNPFFDIDKTIAIPSLGIEPTKAATIKNQDLPRDDVKVVVFITVKEKKLVNVICKDVAILHTKQGATKVIFESNGSFCPSELDPGKTYTFILPRSNDAKFVLQNTGDFKDSIVINTATINATAEGAPTPKNSSVATITIGNPPANCPSGWPVPTGAISQGPKGATSHANLALGGELAIDISAAIGTPIVATFDGIVVLTQVNNGKTGYGTQVRIQGVCTSKGFIAVFAHLQAIHNNIQENSPVKKGQLIGWVDATGRVEPEGPAGSHLHYSFIGLTPMNPPYIPKAVPPTCNSIVECGVSVP